MTILENKIVHYFNEHNHNTCYIFNGCNFGYNEVNYEHEK